MQFLHGQSPMNRVSPLDTESINECFKVNRMSVINEQILPALQTHDIVIVDRLSLSGAVYAKIRNPLLTYDYLHDHIKDEVIPDMTFVVNTPLDIIE